ncbi:hypothetical protein GCM10010918_03170 [Paenibacillus radicis (ex Gao et al. 2016)]|uniref:Uncharacterized protein n=1 Tax=Paenibacillus radicis (ex Gao et al. 2016) TaxID=1737354 RepID=A0A917GPR7_9BACL|nr:hypothetical protein GCM10010918_03170 [Paenibacillus radicis (ex Gao et al. 2016)]
MLIITLISSLSAVKEGTLSALKHCNGKAFQLLMNKKIQFCENVNPFDLYSCGIILPIGYLLGDHTNLNARRYT